MTRTVALRTTRALVLGLVIAAPADGQAPVGAVEHTVEVRDPGTRIFHVESRFPVLTRDSLDLSLPTWTPGWYTVENYARNMLRLEIADASGNRLPWRMTGKSTWRVATHEASEVVANFDYFAPALGLNQANISDEWAFFTGTQIFLEPLGHRDWPSTVRFVVPPGWSVISSLGDTSDPFVFTASAYDELADATTQLGRFDLRGFEVRGIPHWFSATPAGALTAAQIDTLVDYATRIALEQARVFDGELPYPKYLFHYFFLPSETNTGGGLEHSNSHVSIVGPLGDASPSTHAGLLAHELFHAWNAKRMRPSELWPYDYAREAHTANLWISEGFTNYYASLSLLRTEIEEREAFFSYLTNAVSTLESADAREYTPISAASMSTWLNYGASQLFSLSYYAGGEVVAAMLDLAILQATGGRARLDEVMRALWTDTANRGRGFDRADFERALEGVAGPDVVALLQRMVDEPRPPPYDTLLALAGYRLERIERQLPVLGMVRRTVEGGHEVVSVTPGGAAERAGLRAGDIIQTVNGQPIATVGLPDLVGLRVPIVIVRAGEPAELALDVFGRSAPIFRISELPELSPEQRVIRDRWLGR